MNQNEKILLLLRALDDVMQGKRLPLASVLDVGMVAQPNARQKQQLLVAQVTEECRVCGYRWRTKAAYVEKALVHV